MTGRSTAAPPEPWPAMRIGYAQRTCLHLVACWGMPQAAVCALAVIADLTPASTPDGRPLSNWVEILTLLVGVSAPLAVLLIAPLSFAGFRYLRQVAHDGWRWISRWTAVMAAGIALDTVLVLTVIHGLVPRAVSYPVPAQLSWGWLTLDAAFIAVAMAMAWVLTRAGRQAHPPPPQIFPA